MKKEEFQAKVKSGVLFIRPQAFWKNGCCFWRVVKYSKKEENLSFGWSIYDNEFGCKDFIEDKCRRIVENGNGKIEIG
jgi:hypothetical protein